MYYVLLLVEVLLIVFEAFFLGVDILRCARSLARRAKSEVRKRSKTLAKRAIISGHSVSSIGAKGITRLLKPSRTFPFLYLQKVHVCIEKYLLFASFSQSILTLLFTKIHCLS